jgi:hypothetical protein
MLHEVHSLIYYRHFIATYTALVFHWLNHAFSFDIFRNIELNDDVGMTKCKEVKKGAHRLHYRHFS